MSVTDPIADLLTRIRNGHMAKHEKVDLPFSKLKYKIVRILKEEGYIKNFKEIDVKGAFPIIRVYLKYQPNGKPLINGLQRVSKPGRRVYRGKDEIPEVLKGLGISILTTNRGVMTNRRAKSEGVGGEVLCKVW
ncbi:MAG: 30S ribosomal protein S8 [Acidobacteria bacterium]|nr:MAG: 30S ribosomal protein S8 [Acidobacteriota bacterium]PIE89993.1 MAG: 30S ribosomal protein S8 [Acidobacteriota bacterium]